MIFRPFGSGMGQLVHRVASLPPARDLGAALHAIRHDDKLLTGLLFARPEAGLAKNELLPGIAYFHHRSAANIDLHCIGYSDKGGDGLRPIETVEGRDWHFDDRAFNASRAELERRTRWRYSGEVDLLLFNVPLLDEDVGRVPDFSRALCLDVELLIEEKAVDGLARLLEMLFRYAESIPSDDPVGGFSDRMGWRIVRAGLIARLWDWIKLATGVPSGAARYAVRDITI